MGISQRLRGTKVGFLGELRALDCSTGTCRFRSVVREKNRNPAISPGQHCIRNRWEMNQSAQATGFSAFVSHENLFQVKPRWPRSLAFSVSWQASGKLGVGHAYG